MSKLETKRKCKNWCKARAWHSPQECPSWRPRSMQKVVQARTWHSPQECPSCRPSTNAKRWWKGPRPGCLRQRVATQASSANPRRSHRRSQQEYPQRSPSREAEVVVQEQCAGSKQGRGSAKTQAPVPLSKPTHKQVQDQAPRFTWHACHVWLRPENAAAARDVKSAMNGSVLSLIQMSSMATDCFFNYHRTAWSSAR